MLGRVSVCFRNWRTKSGTVSLRVFPLPSESVYTHEHQTKGRSPAKPDEFLATGLRCRPIHTIAAGVFAQERLGAALIRIGIQQ